MWRSRKIGRFAVTNEITITNRSLNKRVKMDGFVKFIKNETRETSRFLRKFVDIKAYFRIGLFGKKQFVSFLM
jgi:hypothetical protein